MRIKKAGRFQTTDCRHMSSTSLDIHSASPKQSIQTILYIHIKAEEPDYYIKNDCFE